MIFAGGAAVAAGSLADAAACCAQDRFWREGGASMTVAVSTAGTRSRRKRGNVRIGFPFHVTVWSCHGLVMSRFGHVTVWSCHGLVAAGATQPPVDPPPDPAGGAGVTKDEVPEAGGAGATKPVDAGV